MVRFFIIFEHTEKNLFYIIATYLADQREKYQHQNSLLKWLLPLDDVF